MGHIKMMAATQPFLSGAISKTVNLPQDGSVDDIAEAYTESWRQGLKAVAIYRDDSKGTQPLNTSLTPRREPSGARCCRRQRHVALAAATAAAEADLKTLEAKISAKARSHCKAGHRFAARPQRAIEAHLQGHISAADLRCIGYATLNAGSTQNLNAPPRAVRHRLPEERASITHKFCLAGHEGYITVGLYPNGQPGEIFIRMAKEGSTVSGLMDSFATAISLALQHGVPLKRALREIRPHPLRALRLDRQRADRLRQEPSWITSSAGSTPLPLRRAVDVVRGSRSASRTVARIAVAALRV